MDTEIYKVRLESMLKDLTEELKTVGIQNPENEKDWIAVPQKIDEKEPDANISADATEDWNERRAIVATLETRYNNIKNALARIEEGTYGVCEVCEKQIEPQRLDANPAAATCIAHIEETTI